jgi:hypothetical protein
VQAAQSALHDTTVLLADLRASEPVQQRIQAGEHYDNEDYGEHYDNEEYVDKMFAHIEKECTAMVGAMEGRPAEEYNDDAQYKLAYEDVTDIKSLAAGVVDLWLSKGVDDAIDASELKLKVSGGWHWQPLLLLCGS